MAHLYLVRHGQIAANVSRHWHGSLDTPLTDEGRRQVRRLANHFSGLDADIHAIYSSPFERTRDTAQAIADGLQLPLRFEPEVREYSIGTLEGTSFTDLTHQHRFFEQVRADPTFKPANGESIVAVASRMATAISRIASTHATERVIVVSHGAALAVLLAQLLHSDPLRWNDFPIHNASISELEFSGAPRLLRLNDTGHL